LFKKQESIFISHPSPVYPVGQLHLKADELKTVQVPPFKHLVGANSQIEIWIKQVGPVKLGGHKHL
jgi:hypothetical protein